MAVRSLFLLLLSLIFLNQQVAAKLGATQDCEENACFALLFCRFSRTSNRVETMILNTPDEESVACPKKFREMQALVEIYPDEYYRLEVRVYPMDGTAMFFPGIFGFEMIGPGGKQFRATADVNEPGTELSFTETDRDRADPITGQFKSYQFTVSVPMSNNLLRLLHNSDEMMARLKHDAEKHMSIFTKMHRTIKQVARKHKCIPQKQSEASAQCRDHPDICEAFGYTPLLGNCSGPVWRSDADARDEWESTEHFECFLGFWQTKRNDNRLRNLTNTTEYFCAKPVTEIFSLPHCRTALGNNIILGLLIAFAVIMTIALPVEFWFLFRSMENSKNLKMLISGSNTNSMTGSAESDADKNEGSEKNSKGEAVARKAASERH